ncbi:OmpA family protein [Nannocystis punicea]|uniref:OmpA family protein n=1 Tax=Nannocystis punicea TaxID=2995304 RepID=A0ABY7H4T0_9BACT|nr:OmpA family protein [Nannocystis poenicansa]WAS94272.1 OmpA family protein [Nannocystis poenicansa]
MRRPPRPLVVVLALAGLAGCKASASLSVSTPPLDGSADKPIVRASAVTIVRQGDKLAYENGEIEFETGSAALKGGGSDDILDRYTAILKQYPDVKVRIEGHTDSRGSTKSNQELSDLRAKSLRAALVRRGVAAERLEARGFGESQPERVEPTACRNRSEDTVADNKLAECQEIWTTNRRAGFIITEGADSLPAEGAVASAPEPTPVPEARSAKRPPDWALRLFGGYSLMYPGDDFHGGHFGIGVHASQRFGARDRGYIGGGPRLHYRGVRGRQEGLVHYDFATHYIGPEGNLLIGGGNERIVGLFSLRLGLGVGITHGTFRDVNFAGWLLGGPMVLGKINERWSLGGHAEFGIIGSPGSPAFATEIGLNAAWHFGRGRRKGI